VIAAGGDNRGDGRPRLVPSHALQVEDDGKGFDASATSMGTGVQGMADRLAALGGDVRVGSAPGRGTVVSGGVPAARIETSVS